LRSSNSVSGGVLRAGVMCRNGKRLCHGNTGRDCEPTSSDNTYNDHDLSCWLKKIFAQYKTVKWNTDRINLHTPYTQRCISNDLEWLSKISNDARILCDSWASCCVPMTWTLAQCCPKTTGMTCERLSIALIVFHDDRLLINTETRGTKKLNLTGNKNTVIGVE